MKKLLSLIVALAMLLCAVPLEAVAEEMSSLAKPSTWELKTEYYINPMYAGLISEGDLVTDNDSVPVQSESFANISEAGEYIRRNFANRVANFEFTLRTPCSWDDVKAEIARHTGNPLFGDSIKFQCSYRARYNPNGMYYNLIPTYYTTAAQEAELTAKIKKVMAELNLFGKSDYEKIRVIYKYICDNVVYDYDHLGMGSEYLLMYTAYAALVNGTSVCQGYAVLFYRMCLEAGVDNRVISGIGNGGAHAWNIVRLGRLYYNCDSTWDAGGWNNEYFLRGSNYFGDHTRNNDYNTDAFNAAYPTSSTDYVASADDVIDSGCCGGEGDGTNLSWKLTGDGTLTISGNGKMADWRNSMEIPWSNYSSKIISVKFEGRAANISDWAFAWCERLTSIAIPSSVTNIGDYAFYWCESLTSVRIPNGVARIGDNAFSRCKSLKSFRISNSVTRIGQSAFKFCEGLTSIIIPSSVAEMGENAFWGCTNMTDIYCEAESKPESWGREWDYDIYPTTWEEGIGGEIHWGYTPSAVLYGDVDGDGEVTPKDRVTLARYLAGWAEYKDINEAAADVDGDGEITPKDRVTLARHIAGWTGYETLPCIGR